MARSYEDIMEGARAEAAEPRMVKESQEVSPPPLSAKAGKTAPTLPGKRTLNPLIPAGSGGQLADRLSQERALAPEVGQTHTPGLGPHKIFVGKKIN